MNMRITNWRPAHWILPCLFAVGSATLIAPAVQAENILRVGNMGEPESMDPHHLAGTWENRITGDMFLGLTTEAADGSVVEGAAESWSVSDDGLTYTFTLRDHTWSDGTPVTADDFVFSLRRILHPETAAKYASILYPIKNAEPLNKKEKDGMESLGVRAIDAKTLEITLEAPTPYFLEQLTHYTAFPVPKHVVEAHGDDWTKKENIVSNGPYVFDNWVPNSEVVLVKNEKFYDAANVSIEKVVFYPAEDRTQAQKRFRAGELDITKDFASDQIDWLKSNLPDETHVAPYLGIYYYTINTAKAPFDDKRVRQALSMAIDREVITEKVLKTGEVPAYSFVPPGVGNYPEPSYVTWKDTPIDERVANAKVLLAEAGFDDSNPLNFTLSYNTSENHKRIAVAVTAMWKQLGVQAELFNSEVKVHYDMLESHDFDIGRAGWIADYNDAQNFLFLLESTSGPLNYASYNSAEFDGLMDKANGTKDLAARAKLMADAETIAMVDQPIIPIYYYVSKSLVSKRVKGYIDNTKDMQRTRYLSLE